MKYPPILYCPMPTLVIPFVVVTILFAYQLSHAQPLASDVVSSSVVQKTQVITAQLDPSAMINSNYNTFIKYRLTGGFEQAVIEIRDNEEHLRLSFPIVSDEHGFISLPACFLPEGNYRLNLLVNGEIRDSHPLKIVR